MKSLGFVLISALVMLICSCAKSTKLPDHVTEAEIKLFQAWLDRHAALYPERTLFVEQQTFLHEEQWSADCAAEILAGGASKSMLQSLHENGKTYSIPSVPADWKYQWAGSPAYIQAAKSNFDTVLFSRAAFSPDSNEALFAFHYGHCEAGGCGGGIGHAVLATKTKGGWSFKSTGCSTID